MLKFIDKEHKEFYEQKLKEVEKADVYTKSLIYTLAICPTTRQHFTDIFNSNEKEININSLQAPYQTTTSSKVTRVAFNLFNNCNYDSEEDIEKNKTSMYYNISDIFCCSYAPYFYEAIKLRFPEYTKNNNTIEEVIELVREKYSDDVDILIHKNTLTLEYMYLINNERDCYQLMNITEFENKLSLEYIPQHIIKVIDIEELEDIFEMLHKQSTYKPLTNEEIQITKQGGMKEWKKIQRN